ncbi:hypothetical protein RB4607 [Rhodopirellula baltica SH 1]|uniref:Uncharacterized protein n=1 Tax=Rhodopirellula baltica (strain DSM 10527 / NCIMB 13988 / SH1) TaxID=243090 RepID=Q7USB3_RHOBA|nr:hypothetical protein RB4607 [Rhodopirellula baltica SH 1]
MSRRLRLISPREGEACSDRGAAIERFLGCRHKNDANCPIANF